ncbi:sigma-70 family RNA polymerase sigma factor [Bacillus sp. Marseille-P3800]|uniref:sigma-70 family RNA polymerase sigma factor n=1 Tax=Bacillus sp. Marseille-P3800 TaxID=2014782 RepID=UPI000C06C300|nr:sigma-70 family RNA polymerase sigma factor [Bacillus sp. Marseille-P3800]
MKIDKKNIQFLIANFEKINNPIMIRFLNEEENLLLVKRFIDNPIEENMQVLDEEFRFYFYKVKLVHYMTKLVENYVYDSKKRYSRFHNRNVLILDDERENSDSSLHDYLLLKSNTLVNNQINECLSLLDCIEDKYLHNLLTKLKQKHLKILDLFYIYDMKNHEIAQFFGDSPQYISTTHRGIIKRLYQNLECGNYE